MAVLTALMSMPSGAVIDHSKSKLFTSLITSVSTQTSFPDKVCITDFWFTEQILHFNDHLKCVWIKVNLNSSSGFFNVPK